MPELHDMLTDAVPQVEPRFDEGDVRARVAAAERRQRRVAIGSMLAVVTLIAVLVAPALLPDQPQSVLIGPDQPPGELVPLSQWPSSFEFAGVEIGVKVMDEPDEVIQGRAAVGAGEAGLNTEPDGPEQESGVDGYRSRTWFGCGTGQVVRMVEIGRAPDAPAFDIAGPGDRWLPPGALLEAARQLTQDLGCTPEAPPGTPQAERGGQPWLMPFAAAIDEAGLVTCCFHGFTPPQEAPANHAGHVSEWGVLLSGDDRLSLSVGGPDTIYWDDTAAEPVQVGQGVAANQAISNSPADVLWFVCDGVSILAYPTSGEAESVGRFVDRIGCAPRIHPSFTRSLALSELLRDVGGVVVATTPDPAIGISRVRLDGIVLEVRSGTGQQIGLSPDAMAAIGEPGAHPLGYGPGAIVACGVTHAIHATDEAGADLAMALAERLFDHPDCGLESIPELPATSDPDPPNETTDEVQPLSSAFEAQAEILADGLEERLREAGFDVTRETATLMHVAIPTMADVRIAEEAAADDAEAPEAPPLVGIGMQVAVADQAETPELEGTVAIDLAGGVALLLDDDAFDLVFTCAEASITLQRERIADDDHLIRQAFFDAGAAIAEALSCTPQVPAGDIRPGDDADVAAFVASLEAAGLSITTPPVVADTATLEYHPRSADAGTGSWMVSIEDIGRWTVDGDTELVQLDDGGEVAHMGLGVVIFTCDGVGVRMAGDTGAVEAEPIAELTGAAGCAARPPGLSREIGTDDASNPVSGGVSIREARLFDAFDALRVERCCGEPSHGGSGAATGMVWEDTEVFIFANPPMTDDPDYQVGDLIELAGGRADLGDGDGLPGIGFDCGDTNYQLRHDSTNADVQIRAAEALVEQLDCTPRVGPAD